MTVLEKLLVPEASRRVVEQGYDELTGPVYRPDDQIGPTPVERVRAQGLEGDDFPFGAAPDHVDVIRFGTNPLMDLRIPTDGRSRRRAVADLSDRFPPRRDPGLGPDHDPGAARAPDSSGSDRDGTEREFSRYDGAAGGWRRRQGLLPAVAPHRTAREVARPGPAGVVHRGPAGGRAGVGGGPGGAGGLQPGPSPRCTHAWCPSPSARRSSRWSSPHAGAMRRCASSSRRATRRCCCSTDPTVESVNSGWERWRSSPASSRSPAPAAELTDREGVRSDPMPTQPRTTHG